ncbi:complement receptor type 2-like [Mauremys mutica]|uniref:complement receptor type 2-like n=1 Tax=Mauremys mutica TaxID=74926 RepID=UPI001D16E193|nr:complement receptor type 2-like [Mauremys mutica]
MDVALETCEPPARIANGWHDRVWENDFLVGSRVSYSCKHEIPRCPNPVVENGEQISISETEYTIGNRVEFQCESGYILEGSKSIECQSNKTCNPRVPSCIKGYCVDPPDIPNAVWKTDVGTLIPAGMVIKYGCRPGYELIAGIRQGNVTCLQNSTWSSAPNFCQKVRCPAPDVNNGTLKPMPRPGEETYAFEDRVTIECDLGYVCAQPPNISHGQYYDWGKRVFVVGSSVTYKCDRGFSLVGKASIQCVAGDEVTPTWSEPTPQCEETQCPVPRIQHGSLKSPLPHNYTYRTSVMFQCDLGYILRGAGRIQCQADGKWYPQLPVCDLVCAQPPNISHGQYNDWGKRVFVVGSSVTYKCDRGFSLVGKASIQCVAGDEVTPTWSEPTPQCEETQCPVPRIQHGSLKSPLPHNYTYRTSVTFQCDPGYILRGADRIQCQADGKWYPQVPICDLGRCSYPPVLACADRSDHREFLVGTVVTYSCKPGYTRIPGVSPHVTCLTNFTWSKISELCQKTRCPKPMVENGKQISPVETEYTYANRVVFQCDPDYILRGSEGIVCRSDGMWHPPVPFCDKTCGRPPTLTNGLHNGGMKEYFPYESQVTYSCGNGLSLIGESSIYCTSDGVNMMWSGPAPQCKVVRCPRPQVENGRMTTTRQAFTYGVTVRFSCKEGYLLHGSRVSQCQDDNAWNPPAPSCQPVQCSKPDVQNGRMVNALDEKMWYNVNESITFKCSPGYHFSDHWYLPTTDSLSITCSANGNWTALPKCQKQSNTEECTGARESKEFLHCDVPLTELRTLLELKKLYLEIQKLKREIKKLPRPTPPPFFSLVLSTAPAAARSSLSAPAMSPGLPGPALALGLLALLLLLLPGTRSDCGPLPKLNYAIPSDMDWIEGFPVDTQVTYKCRDGFFKIPGKSDTVVCLSNSQWSNINEFCGRGCDVPTRLKFAALSKDDESRNYYPPGITVRYTCRPGYENITEMLLVSTCLDNLTWSEAPEFCRRKSCGHPGEVLHGRAVHKTEFLYGAKIDFLCEDGYKLIGRPFIHCGLKGDEVEWSELPTCQAITCSSPPYIANGTYDSRGAENFAYNSTVTYRCDRGFQLIGAASIHCTTKDKTSGIWSGPAPKCKDTTARVLLKGNETSGTFSGSYNVSSNMVPEQHLKKKIKSRLYYVSQFQNKHFTITSSRSSSFPRGDLRTRGSWITPPLFRFAVPLYVNQNYCSVRRNERSICRQSYMGISGVLPSATCFQNLKWSEVPGFCGTRSLQSRRTRAWQSCCYNRFPIRCKSGFHP